MFKIKGLDTFINESISKSDLDSIEAYADSLFKRVGIDVEFTRHFLERLNDVRNKKAITSREVEELFKKTYQKHGKKYTRFR